MILYIRKQRWFNMFFFLQWLIMIFSYIFPNIYDCLWLTYSDPTQIHKPHNQIFHNFKPIFVIVFVCFLSVWFRRVSSSTDAVTLRCSLFTLLYPPTPTQPQYPLHLYPHYTFTTHKPKNQPTNLTNYLLTNFKLYQYTKQTLI